MKKNYPYLKDDYFLRNLYDQHNKTTYVSIAVLDWEENFIQRIEGRVISASISVNGDSSVRRTANLSIKLLDETENYNNINSLFSINKKIYLETGYKNNLRHLGEAYYPEYETIWFPFGVFIITSYALSHDVSGLTLSLTLNDKMALLNGTAGGVIPASTNFESYDELGPDGDLHTQEIRINQIIPELVNHFGCEDLNNIFVNDIPNKITTPLKWISSNPLYLFRNISDLADSFYTTIKTNVDLTDYTKTEFTYGYDCGYTYLDFTYPEELAAAPGDSVCTVLDKIKTKLGNYEYYYDIFGNFIFQEIKNYVNTSEWRDAFNNYDPTNPSEIALPYAYNKTLNGNVFDLSKSNYVISYNNTPKYEMIKNDFIVWGVRKSICGLDLPCRYHLAIDERPVFQSNSEDGTWDVNKLYTNGFCFDISMDDYIKRAFPIEAVYGNLNELINTIPEGIVGKYYLILGAREGEGAIYTWVTDVQGYNNALNNYLTSVEGISNDEKVESEDKDKPIAGYIELPLAHFRYGENNHFKIKPTTDWRNLLYWQGVIASKTGSDQGYYFAELYNEWPKIYDVEEDHYYEDAIKAPSAMDWWLDIIDNDSELNKFSVKNIGRRSYAKAESGCNCVFEATIPDIIMVDMGDEETMVDSRSQMTRQQFAELGMIPIQVEPSTILSTAIGGSFNSCYENVKQLLNDYTNYNESVSLTCIPLYHLEPNTRIHLDDPESGIYGDYLINTISYNLGNDGTMSMSLKKVIEKI